MKHFTHLHVHSEFSTLDGLGPIERLVEMAATRRNVKTMALTDHGGVAGFPLFYAACKEYGVKPIFGIEAYFTPNATIKDKNHRHFGHITILAKNKSGYLNLIALTTESNQEENFYYRARVDWAMLRKYREGLVVLTGCPGGILPKAIEADVGEEVLEQLQDIFGHDLYGEVHYHDLADPEMNDKIRALCGKMGIPTVAANDAHYPLAQDADVHPLLVAMATKKPLGHPDAFTIDTRELYLKTWDEMARDGQRHGTPREIVMQEMEQANAIGEMVEEFDISREVVYPVPPRWANENPVAVLERLIELNLGKVGHDPVYVERARKEFEVIVKKGFTEYFLVLADLYQWAHENQIITGPGRGSAAASLVLYLVGVTGVDPIKYPVMKFERFLNEHRQDEPDVDTDWASHQRDQVIEYLENTYGEDRVARMGTHTTYAAKMLVNDMAKALRAKVRRIELDILPSTWNAYLHDAQVARLEGREPEVVDPSLKSFLVDVHRRLDSIEKQTSFPARRAFYTMAGQIRHMGTHAAAIVLSDEPLNRVAPLVRVGGKLVVGYSSSTNRSLYVKTGLLKLDVLGIRALEILDTMYKEIGCGIEWDAPYDDEQVLAMYRKGLLTGIFQFESGAGITRFTQELAPKSFTDIYTIQALYRPGPLRTGISKRFIESGQAFRHTHKIVDEILQNTRGMMIFQEDLIAVYSTIADCSPGEADLFRRDIIKQMTDHDYKKRMETHKHRWLDGCRKKNIPQVTADRLWREMLSFGKYGFNAPHAVCYAAIGYKQMWIKAHYPATFIAASLDAAFDQGRAQEIVVEAGRMGITIKPPHINFSDVKPVAAGNTVFMHFAAIKGIGSAAAEAIIEARKGGKFSSIDDFRDRVSKRAVNTNGMTNLLRLNAFDGLSGHDKWLKEKGLVFAEIGSQDSIINALGIVLDMSMPNQAVEAIKKKKRSSSKTVVTGGLVTGVRKHRTKKGRDMAFVQLLTIDGIPVSIIVWPSMWPVASENLAIGGMVLVKGDRSEKPATLKCRALGFLDSMGNLTGGVKSVWRG